MQIKVGVKILLHSSFHLSKGTKVLTVKCTLSIKVKVLVGNNGPFQ